MSDTDDAIARALHAHADAVAVRPPMTPTGFLLVLDASEVLATARNLAGHYTRPDLEALPVADVRRARATVDRALYELRHIKGLLDRIADRDAESG